MKDEWDFSVLVLQFIGICNHFKIKKKVFKKGEMCHGSEVLEHFIITS